MVKLAPLSPVGRVTRRPEHTFQLRTKPWVIQPFMIAPVLPGETLKNLLLQARVVSDPIKNPLIGWWIEYYFFYVKHRDLSDRETLEDMMLDGELTLASLYSAAKVDTYHYAGSYDWVQKCLDRVVEIYFRGETDTTAHEIGGMPLAQIGRDTWLDSATRDTDFVTASDVDVEGPDVNTTIQASEIDKAMRTWQLLRAQNLTDMSYDDYLRTFGIKSVTDRENHEPELIRYVKEWTYPTNTIDPSTGARHQRYLGRCKNAPTKIVSSENRGSSLVSRLRDLRSISRK